MKRYLTAAAVTLCRLARFSAMTKTPTTTAIAARAIEQMNTLAIEIMARSTCPITVKTL